MFLILSKICPTHFRRKTAIEKITVERNKKIDIYFILDQTKLKRAQ